MKGKRTGIEELLASGLLRKGDGEAPSQAKAGPARKISVNSTSNSFDVEFFRADFTAGNACVAALERLSPEKLKALFPQELGALDSVEELGFLDIETTGIGYGAKAFLIGLGKIVPREGFLVRRFFMESAASEAETLLDAAAEVKTCRAIVTYNGANFDLPVIEERLRVHSIPTPFKNLPHLDLLKFCRKIFRKDCRDAKLQTLERELLGFVREGDIAGRDIPAVWREFSLRGKSGRMGEVFWHNSLDILTLALLLDHLADPAFACGPTALANLGVFNARRGHGEKALEQLRKALGLGLGAGETLAAAKELSRLLRKRGEAKEAARLCLSLHEKNPAEPFYLIEGAKAAKRAGGEISEALELMEVALSKTPWHPKDREKIEKLRQRLGKKVSR